MCVCVCVCVCVEGHVAKLEPPHTQCLGFKGENVQIAGVKEKRFKLRG